MAVQQANHEVVEDAVVVRGVVMAVGAHHGAPTHPGLPPRRGEPRDRVGHQPRHELVVDAGAVVNVRPHRQP